MGRDCICVYMCVRAGNQHCMCELARCVHVREAVNTCTCVGVCLLFITHNYCVVN